MATRDDMMGYGRFGYFPGKFKGCRFCHGRGCAGCDEEAKAQFPAFKAAEDAEYARLFPNGPVPIATFRTDSPADMAELKRVFGAESLQRAFGPVAGDDELVAVLAGKKARGLEAILEKLRGGNREG